MGHFHKEYLITADLGQLVGQWAKRHCFTPPSADIFYSIDVRIASAVQQSYGPDIVVNSLPVECLINGVRHLLNTKAHDLPVIMMDHAIQTAADGRRVLHYSATRLVEWDPVKRCWHRDTIEGPRPNTPSLVEQCRAIAEALGVGTEVVVVDDGCYDGKSLRLCADLLSATGLNVVQAIVGIRRDKGDLPVDFPVHAVRTYLEHEIADWVCARDFILGVPDSGRAVKHDLSVVKECSAPYLANFGEMHGWGSIPLPAVNSLTIMLLETSRDLFQAIGAANSRPVLVSDIDRWPFYNGAPMEVNESGEFVACIEDVLSDMKKLTT